MMTIHVDCPRENMTEQVRRILQEGNETALISFEQGVYHFRKEGAYCGNFYPSNNASGEKKVVFPILKKKNLIVDGNGSRFVFDDRVFPFVIQDSENITLRNFTIEFSFPRYYYGTVDRFDGKNLYVRIDREKYPFSVENGNWKFPCGSETISTVDRKVFLTNLTKRQVVYLFAGECTCCQDHLAAGKMLADVGEYENGAVLFISEKPERLLFEKGDQLLISHDEGRENDIIFLENARNLTFENITIYSGAGMGIIGQLCTNILIDGVNIIPKDEEQMRSITADGFHFVNCDGELVIRNCELKRTLDDAVNIHGVYTICDKVLSEKQIVVKYHHVEQYGLIAYKKGDEVRISDGVTMCEMGTVRIADVSYDEERFSAVLTFEDSITGLIQEGSLIENPDRMPSIRMENNRFIDCPHVLVSSAQKTVIRHNFFDLSDCSLCVQDLIAFWYESGAVKDLLITDNDFTARGNSIVISSTRCPGSNKVHENIVIENNRFAHSKEKAITVGAARNLTVQNNSFGARI